MRYLTLLVFWRPHKRTCYVIWFENLCFTGSNRIIMQRKQPKGFVMWKVWFGLVFSPKAYQPSWVIKYLNHPGRRVAIIPFSQLLRELWFGLIFSSKAYQSSWVIKYLNHPWRRVAIILFSQLLGKFDLVWFYGI